jgi:hypothetical protein
MNHRLLSSLIAAAAGIVPVAASADQPGQIGSRSQASISINLSVAPRVRIRGSEQVNSGGVPLMCLVSSLSPTSFAMTALPNSGSGGRPSAGGARQAAASASSVGCGSGQSTKADLAMLPAPVTATKDQSDRGPFVLIVRPE